MHRKRGFTLIELLVVIAVIAILAAILFPVFAQAREKSRSAACLSNCKQMGTAVMMYAQDYDESIMPWLISVGGSAGVASAWTNRIQPYLKNGAPTRVGTMWRESGVAACPSFSEARLRQSMDAPDCDGPGASARDFPPLHFFATYCMAFQMAAVAGMGTQERPFRRYPGSGGPVERFINTTLPSILRPAETALIADGATYVTGGTSPGFWGAGFGCEAAAMHQGGGNFIFLDGHAKKLVGNAERYLKQRADGKWFELYFTYDME